MEQALDAASRQSELTPTTTRGKLAFTLLILAITSFALLYAVTRAFVRKFGQSRCELRRKFFCVEEARSGGTAKADR